MNLLKERNLKLGEYLSDEVISLISKNDERPLW